MSKIRDSWNAIAPTVAKEYLKTFGHPAESSKLLLLDILRSAFGTKKPRILDLGCGNGQLFEFFKAHGWPCRYTGIDFSQALLDVAEAQSPDGMFIQGDINDAGNLVQEQMDCVIYSHVLEMLESPEQSLIEARKLAKTVAIRFFEPPEFEVDTVELREMDLGAGSVPYLRRKMSKSYYRLILANAGCKSVDVYRDTSKDQIHVLHF